MQAGRQVPTASKRVPLALPRATESLCELCQGEARLQCTQCRVTAYCGEEHQRADWLGIHGRICELLVPIRTSAPLIPKHAGHNEMRLRKCVAAPPAWDQYVNMDVFKGLACDLHVHILGQVDRWYRSSLWKVELIEVCRSVAQSRLSERKHLEALPAAQSCLRCSVDLYGPSTVQLVPAYLLLAEANMGLGNLPLVRELLCQAEWAVLRSPECGHAVLQQLHRSLGRLHVATGNLEAALVNFGNDYVNTQISVQIYFASEEHGPDSTTTCAGFFLMAEVFAKQGKMPVVRSLFSQVAHIWHLHLTELLQAHVHTVQHPILLSKAPYVITSSNFRLDEAQGFEVDEMLRTMLDFQQNDSRKDWAQIAIVAHCLAMLWFLKRDSVKALGFGSTALQASQMIPNQDLTEPIQGLLQLVHDLHTDPRPGCD